MRTTDPTEQPTQTPHSMTSSTTWGRAHASRLSAMQTWSRRRAFAAGNAGRATYPQPSRWD